MAADEPKKPAEGESPAPAAPRKKGSGKKKKGAKKQGPALRGTNAPSAPPVSPPGVFPTAPGPYLLAGAVALALLSFTIWAWPPRPAPNAQVERGNDRYRARQYPAALSEYESAPGGGARYAGVQLNRGLARYRVAVPPPDAGGLPMLPPDASAPEGLTRAQDELRTAARGGTTNAEQDVDVMMRARASYDLGNTLFTQHAWDNAIDAYKEALRLRPGWRDAAWNMELARRLREEERHPPDAGQDASQDAAQDAAQDASPPDAGNDGGMDSGAPDSGGRDGGGDSGGDSGGDGGQGDAAREGGAGDAGAPDSATPPRDTDGGVADAAPPRSLAPLDELDRSSRTLQEELLRRRAMTPRGPDDDR